ncbi:MAG: type II secretion system protein [Phycisphaeraceae bacterium]
MIPPLNQHEHDRGSGLTSPRRKPGGSIPSRRAFTLIEILVVISIITVLVALTLVGVTAVTANSNQWATESTLATLDAAVDEYYQLNNRYPRANTGNTVYWDTSQNRMRGWPEQFFDELQKYGDIGAMLGPLLQSPPTLAGNEDNLDIRDASPIADGWGYGIVPIVPRDLSTNPSVSDLRPFFYSSGPNGTDQNNTDNGGIETDVVIAMNENSTPANLDLNDIQTPAGDDLYSPSAP